MEVKLDKRYPVDASMAQAWAVLGDLRAAAACMPGAEITEQVDTTHFKGQVRCRIGPASMSFSGEIELLGLDTAAHHLRLLGKGADKSGSAASMELAAHLEPADAGCVLVGQATVSVSGKLAQFGSRLLVPASDAMLAQFAANFVTAAQAVPVASPAVAAQTLAPLPGPTSAPMPARAQELNALALVWSMVKSWWAGLWARKA
jgi:hypothetical protein